MNKNLKTSKLAKRKINLLVYEEDKYDFEQIAKIKDLKRAHLFNRMLLAYKENEKIVNP